MESRWTIGCRSSGSTATICCCASSSPFTAATARPSYPCFPTCRTLLPRRGWNATASTSPRAREFFSDPQEVRSARVEMHHELDPGYTDTLSALGVNEHCGMWEANAKPWLGMPEFPYFASSTDCRKSRQEPGGAVVAHQWDFCGGWHFFGPVSWHYKAARGDWAASERCLRLALDEFRELARMSGHPAFVTPLYDGLAGPGYPNPSFQYAQRDPRTFQGEVEDAFVSSRALDAAQIAASWPAELAEVPAPAFVWTPPGTLSGNGHWVEGRRGKALRLDGHHGCFTTDRPAAVEGTEFTIGCWVKPEDHSIDLGQHPLQPHEPPRRIVPRRVDRAKRRPDQPLLPARRRRQTVARHGA